MEKWGTEISRTKERGRIRREKLKLEQVWEIEQKQIGTFLTTVVILDFHYRVLTNGSHLLSFQPMTTKIGMDEGLPIGSHLVPRKLTSASTRPHWRPFS